MQVCINCPEGRTEEKQLHGQFYTRRRIRLRSLAHQMSFTHRLLSFMHLFCVARTRTTQQTFEPFISCVKIDESARFIFCHLSLNIFFLHAEQMQSAEREIEEEKLER